MVPPTSGRRTHPPHQAVWTWGLSGGRERTLRCPTGLIPACLCTHRPLPACSCTHTPSSPSHGHWALPRPAWAHTGLIQPSASCAWQLRPLQRQLPTSLPGRRHPCWLAGLGAGPGKPLESLGGRPSPSTFKASIQSAPGSRCPVGAPLELTHMCHGVVHQEAHTPSLFLSLSGSNTHRPAHQYLNTVSLYQRKQTHRKPHTQTHQVCVHHFLDSELHTNIHKHISVSYVTQQHAPSHTHGSMSPRSHTHRGKPTPVFHSACF